MSYRAVITCPCSSTLWVIMQKVNNLCGISVSDNWKWQVSTIWENGQHQPLCSQPLPLSQGLKTPKEVQEHMVERCPFWQHGEEVSSLGDTSNVLRVTQSWTARAWCNHSWITHPLRLQTYQSPLVTVLLKWITKCDMCACQSSGSLAAIYPNTELSLFFSALKDFCRGKEKVMQIDRL